MKQFLTTLLASLVALFIFSIAALLLAAGIVGALVASSVRHNVPASQRVQNSSYLVFDLSTNITDAPPRFSFSAGLGEDRDGTLQLRTLIRGLHAAAGDDRIKGLLLVGSLRPTALGSGWATLQELRNALLQFKESHKPIRAYLEFATARDYYLASVANEISLDPYGLVYMPGLAAQPMFYAGALQKFGINVQVTRVGKYKAYVEPFIRENMSPEFREEEQRLLDDLWGNLTGDVARARGLHRADVQAVVDAQGLIRPEPALKGRLVDNIKYRDEIISDLRQITGKASDSESFRQIAIGSYLHQVVTESPSRLSGDGIAVVYAEGDIVNGDGSPGDIGGTRYARELRKLRLDDRVKAVVLRVNSPGGSATAAEQILRELVLTRKVKPVVVSMGTYAASGGYWISSDADRIFAEPTTITGSIGVFGIQFDIQKLANNWGLTFDSVKTGRFADALTVTRPKSPEELAVLQGLVDWIYGQFIVKVSEGRHLPKAEVERIAQGRVWSGVEARKLHLVDDIGGLRAAMNYAARKAGLAGDNYRVMEYPRRQDFQQALAELLGRVEPDTAHAQGVVGAIEKTLEAQWSELRSYNDPQGVYARLPLNLSLR